MEARTILVPDVSWPVLDAGVLGLLAEVAVVIMEVVAVVLGLCCSRRF